MKLFLGISVIGFIVMGGLLSLMAIYASPDGKVYFLEASYFWIGNSIAIFGLIYLFKECPVQPSQ